VSYRLLLGNCLDSLHELEDESIDTCITSPPYYGLRDYGTAEWEGGDPNCEHTVSMDTKWNDPKRGKNVLRPEVAHRGGKSNACLKCGATRIDEQIGLEDTPEQFIENLVEVFRLVRKKLKPTGSLWLNIGDSYWGGKGRSGMKDAEVQAARTDSLNKAHHNATGGKGKTRPTDRTHHEIKPKDLIGIPWMLAFALRADGWYLRSDVIWNKPNPMPESVRDRPTKSHEYIFLLTKNKKYYYDHVAIKERDGGGRSGNSFRSRQGGADHQAVSGGIGGDEWVSDGGGRNKRSVWTITTKPYKGAHFAVFPPELIEPCVLASTSAHGCCGKCGAPYTRIIQKETLGDSWLNQKTKDVIKNGPIGGGIGKNRLGPNIKDVSYTNGWQPSCECDEHPVIPSVVLDPFGGSGTTAGVAILHNRNAVICELNEEFAALIPDRVASIASGFRLGQIRLSDYW